MAEPASFLVAEAVAVLVWVVPDSVSRQEWNYLEMCVRMSG